MSPDPDTLGAPVPLRIGPWRGARDERVPEELVEAALVGRHEPGASTLKSDHRSSVVAVTANGTSVVIKEVRKAGARRRLADAFRGSSGRRGWTAGRRLIASGIGTALPLAFLEQRMLGAPTRSLLVSADLRSVPTAEDRLRDPALREPTLAALADLAVALHRNGAIHGDLRVQHVHLDPKPRLIDLESVRFRKGLSLAHRIEDLAQLNASIADELASGAQRRAALARYLSALPFGGSQAEDDVRCQIERRSVARGHKYVGGGSTC